MWELQNEGIWFNKRKIRKMVIKVGETTKDGKVTLKYADYLGWCINSAPGVMLKKKGNKNVIPIEGIKDI